MVADAYIVGFRVREAWLRPDRPAMTVGLADSLMSLVQTGVTVEPAVEQSQRRSTLARFAGPALGLLLPLGLALFWELAVRFGLSDGRLVPPPSVIYATFKELAATGELQRHTLATLLRVAAGFGFGVAAGTLLGAITGYSAFIFRLLDPSLAGAARDPFDRLGAAVHSLVRHF